MGFTKKVDLAMVDLLSLEPIDKKFRPLRLHECLWVEEKWKK